MELQGFDESFQITDDKGPGPDRVGGSSADGASTRNDLMTWSLRSDRFYRLAIEFIPEFLTHHRQYRSNEPLIGLCIIEARPDSEGGEFSATPTTNPADFHD